MIPADDTIARSAQRIYQASRLRVTEYTTSNGASLNGAEPDISSEDVTALDIVEQAVLLIDQMNKADWLRLLALSPHFHWFANTQTPTVQYTPMEKVEADANRAIEQFYEFMGDKKVDGDQPFLNELSLNEFYALPEEEQEAIWTAEEEPYLDEYEEREVTNELPSIPSPYNQVSLPRVVHPIELK